MHCSEHQSDCLQLATVFSKHLQPRQKPVWNCFIAGWAYIALIIKGVVCQLLSSPCTTCSRAQKPAKTVVHAIEHAFAFSSSVKVLICRKRSKLAKESLLYQTCIALSKREINLSGS
jgi:hypothetical protein